MKMTLPRLNPLIEPFIKLHLQSAKHVWTYNWWIYSNIWISFPSQYLMKKKARVAYAQDLVIRVIVYGILGYHNDGLLSVWYRKFEI